MKASAAILTSMQRPMTIFGLPPKLAGIAAGLPVPVFAVASLLGQVMVAYVSWIVLTAIALIWLWKRARADHHFETLALVPNRFWKGQKARALLAGGVPSKRRGRAR
ncbi:hypothetical protein [Pacificispira spongiicola]|nr:hypothetical protein [Pacificispira spongiicola]